jgi:hypothetical protein
MTLARPKAKNPTKKKTMPPRPESAGPNRRTTSRHSRIFTVIQRGDYPAWETERLDIDQPPAPNLV